MSEQIYEGTAQYNLIYIFAIHDNDHEGYLKIGETSFSSASSYKQLTVNCEELNQNAHARIKQYTKTALTRYQLLYTELARKQVRLADGTIEAAAFSDHDVHEVLDRSGYDVHKFYDTDRDSEWYKVTLAPAIAAIRAVKQGRNVLTQAEKEGHEASIPGVAEGTSTYAVPVKPKIILREEQNDCIAKTRAVFSRSDRMLWDCKMRFGKTVTAYSLVKTMGYQKVLVVTHRPAVVDGWRSDFDLIFNDDRVFLTKSNIKESDRYTAEDASIDAENDRQLKNLASSGKSFVYFASMQDLRGSSLAGGKYGKNRAVFAMDWDLIIYDEAHEGTQTELGLTVQQLLEESKEGKAPKKVLQLSGTPYNLLNQYEDDNVYSWDYVMEQRSKAQWDEKHPGDHNPYADLPELRICTFDLRKKMKTSYRYEDESIAFNFREFFRTWTGDHERDFRPLPAGAKVGDFVHADDVWEFLNLISSDSEDSNYPFANQQYRDMFKHTFWILPGVKEARAFSAMLKEHPVFKEYEVVNVAGEGDVEQPYDDALRAVRDAIKKHDRTITLSCGKLTTGVTVKEWTGVMLLSGSASTGAAGYMQTIFRVQSAGSIDGMQKKVCYAFDFAPDRTLKVLSEVHSLKKSAVGTDDAGRVQLGEFLNFCPVLAEGDTGMEFYDVPKMMRQLKRLTVDAAVKSGFDDDSIYKADAGIVMDKQKLQLVEILRMRLIPQKKNKKQTSVPVNEQGLTDEQYQKAQDAKRKPKRERTPEEIEALEKEREMRKKQQALFDLLRNISIRLPLLIYGTATEFDESIRLENFISIVDEASWKEFMPKEVDKELFRKLLVFYDEDVIEGAGMRIRRLAKAADEMMPTQRVLRIAEIFSYFRNPAKETVLTPWRVVNMHMGDTIGGYNFYKEGYPEKDGLLENPRLVEQGEVTSDIFLDENVQVLEMNSKSGLYPLYVAYSIYRMMLPREESDMSLEQAQAIWREALKDHLFVLCQTTMAVSITKRTLAGYSDFSVNAIYLARLMDRMQDQQRLARKLTNPATWEREGERMRFDAIVGNPPYQASDGGAGNSAMPIYQKFVLQARVMQPDYVSMIMPSRWMSGGRGLDDFREELLNDKSMSILHDYVSATDCFPTVEIKGGICYFLWDKKHSSECEVYSHANGSVEKSVRYLSSENAGTFIRSQVQADILKKVQAFHEDSVTTILEAGRYFGFHTKLTWEDKENGTLQTADGKSSYPIKSEAVEEYNVKVYVHGGICYIERKNVTRNAEAIDYYKVLLPRSGNPNSTIIGKPKISEPGSCNSNTYAVVIPQNGFKSEREAENFVRYCRTKFFRLLVAMKSFTQMLSPSAYEFVPLQDFSRQWTDQDLYKKYDLSEDEIVYIENSMKPMDEAE